MASLLVRSVVLLVERNISVEHIRSSRAFLTQDAKDVRDMRQWVSPSKFQKWVLIIGKAYKKMDDIPEAISPQTMKKAFDIFRGRMMIAMLVFAFGASYIMILSGRKLRDSGDGLGARGKKLEDDWREMGRKERQYENPK
jgi:hypothetical protein